MKITVLASAACLFVIGLQAENNEAGAWNSKGAAAYLDQRLSWWITWKTAARDHDTFCASCHTVLPYALGRPALRTSLGESGPSANERELRQNVAKRVRLWQEVLPFYSDEKNGAPKTAEARGTEAVLNALILTSNDARNGTLSDDARLALDNMWALELKSGERKGAWTWLNFHNVLGSDARRSCCGQYPDGLSVRERGARKSETAPRISSKGATGAIAVEPPLPPMGFDPTSRSADAWAAEIDH